MKTAFVSMLVAVLCALYAPTASASHKMWLLKNGAAECAFATPTSSDTSVNGRLNNNTTSVRTVTCPVAMAARFGSSTDVVFSPPRWADAGSAIVYGSTPNNSSTLSCYAAMSGSNGSLHFSQTVNKSGSTGVQRLDVASHGSWGSGSALEANESTTVVTMDFVCSLPASGGQLFGYKVKICQFTGDCHPVNDDPETDFGGGTSYNSVQTGGIECSPTQSSYNPDITKSVNGITNNHASSHRAVFCPIAPPSDDTAEGNRLVKFTTVHFSGGSSNSTCVADATCPSCYLRWWGRNGLATNGSTFVIDDPGVLQQGPLPALNIGRELQVGVWCVLPPRTTLHGIKSHMTVSDKAGGT